MAFGQKQGSLKNLKKSLAKGGGQGFIKYIPKNGSMNVRFIQEPEEWVNYVEHYDQTARRSFPCNGERTCPGCATGDRKSSRYLANAVDRDDQDRVVPLQLPKDLANRLVIKYEKWGSLTDRDIELSRTGENLDTVYDLDASAPDRKRVDKYTPIDLEKVLEGAYNSLFGNDNDEEDEAPAPIRGRKKSSAAPPKGTGLDDEDAEDEADEEEAPKPAKKTAAKKATKKAAAKAPEPEFEPDDEEEEAEEEPDEPEAEEPEDPEDEDAEEAEEEEFYDEETLKALPLGALRAVAKEFGVATRGKTADQLIEEILDSGEEV